MLPNTYLSSSYPTTLPASCHMVIMWLKIEHRKGHWVYYVWPNMEHDLIMPFMVLVSRISTISLCLICVLYMETADLLVCLWLEYLWFILPLLPIFYFPSCITLHILICHVTSEKIYICFIVTHVLVF